MPTWIMPLAKLERGELERGELSLYGAKIEVTFVRMTDSVPNVHGVEIMVNCANTLSITATMAQVRSLRDCMAYEVADGEVFVPLRSTRRTTSKPFTEFLYCKVNQGWVKMPEGDGRLPILCTVELTLKTSWKKFNRYTRETTLHTSDRENSHLLNKMTKVVALQRVVIRQVAGSS
ncbi:hypothetical protein AC1031_009319 [Aphanomyces cochlioides]|nr:hypothetical protein AC1031_009319 [Aphanomyces cochlioides]